MAGLSRLMMGIPKKEKGRGACLPHSARSRAVLAGRFLILGAQFFVDALCRGGKPQRGRRIVLKIDHIIIIIIWKWRSKNRIENRSNHHGLSRHPQKYDKKGELCLVQSARGRAALAGRFFLRMRYFPLMLYASAENRDWGVGCIESRMLNADHHHHHHVFWVCRGGARFAGYSLLP